MIKIRSHKSTVEDETRRYSHYICRNCWSAICMDKIGKPSYASDYEEVTMIRELKKCPVCEKTYKDINDPNFDKTKSDTCMIGFSVDPMIMLDIIYLNRLGFPTVYSCEGHSRFMNGKYGYNGSYIWLLVPPWYSVDKLKELMKNTINSIKNEDTERLHRIIRVNTLEEDFNLTGNSIESLNLYSGRLPVTKDYTDCIIRCHDVETMNELPDDNNEEFENDKEIFLRILSSFLISLKDDLLGSDESGPVVLTTYLTRSSLKGNEVIFNMSELIDSTFH